MVTSAALKSVKLPVDGITDPICTLSINPPVMWTFPRNNIPLSYTSALVDSNCPSPSTNISLPGVNDLTATFDKTAVELPPITTSFRDPPETTMFLTDNTPSLYVTPSFVGSSLPSVPVIKTRPASTPTIETEDSVTSVKDAGDALLIPMVTPLIDPPLIDTSPRCATPSSKKMLVDSNFPEGPAFTKRSVMSVDTKTSFAVMSVK